MRPFQSCTAVAAALLAFLFSGAPAAAGESTAVQRQAADSADIRQLFADYARLMNDKDTDAIAGKIYDAPVIYHLPDGNHVGYNDQTCLAQVWKRYIDAIEAKQGAVTLEITDVAPCFLNQNTAIVTTRSVRTVLKDNSTALSGWLYVVNRKNGQWKISEISARDLDKSLACP